MDHTPFIIGAYAFGAVVLAWVAIAPLMRKKNIVRDIRRMMETEERSVDTNP